MAPEILERQYYNSKADVWSLGVMLYELMFKSDPYNANDIEDLRRKIKTSIPGALRSGSSDPVVTIIQRCLVVEPTQRISWDGLFNLAN